MSSAHDKYLSALSQLNQAKAIRAKIGKSFAGGGGGIGHISHMTEVKLVVYSQYSNGDKNYHDAPSDLNLQLQLLINEEIIDKAIHNMEQEIGRLAKCAADELNELREKAEKFNGNLTGNMVRL